MRERGLGNICPDISLSQTHSMQYLYLLLFSFRISFHFLYRYVFLKISSFQYLTICTNPCNAVQCTLQLFVCVCSRLFRYFGRVETIQCHNCVSYLVKYYLPKIIVFLYLSQIEDECNCCHQSVCSIQIVALLLICFSIEARILSKIAYFLFAVYLSENCAF